MNAKTITLSIHDWAVILKTLQNAYDEGPISDDGGWKSDDLERAESAIIQALDKAPVIIQP